MVDSIESLSDLKQTVGFYLYDSLKKEGITEIFGVPGDYNFSLLDVLEKYEGINFINCRNELNAGYAADAYARIKGIGAIITTFGVGELSACNAIAGSYCEAVPVIHIIGAPKTMVQQQQKQMHHSLLNGDFGVFRKVYEQITEYTTVITAENASMEIQKAIEKAKEAKRPVYMLLAMDIVNQPVTKKEIYIDKKQTNQDSLHSAVQHIKQVMKQAQKPTLLSGVYVSRYNLQAQVQQIADKINLPVATMIMGKGSFDESHSNYIGLYSGSLGSAEVQNIVEESDCILAIGNMWSDYNTGSFTSNLNSLNMIDIQPDRVKVGAAVYENVSIQYILKELLASLDKKMSWTTKVTFPYDNINVSLDEDVYSRYYYPRFQQMLKENDVIIADAGTFEFGIAQLRLPKGAAYIAQGGWGSIGYGIPAAFGACTADKNRRVILFIGDGSSQMTVQELSSIMINDCKPIIFLVNNKEYTIEKYLNVKQKKTHYNNIPSWDYSKLVEAFGENYYAVKVYTNRELDKAIKQAEQLHNEKFCFIEIYAPQMDAPDIVHKMTKVLEKVEK